MPKPRPPRLTARSADKYVLYTDAVQSPVPDAEFMIRLYRQLNQRPARLLREDFCGTAAISCQWVFMDEANRAIGVDCDPEPIRWARAHYLTLLGRQRRARIALRRADVLNVRTERADVICALNFSFCVFKQRQVLLRYLRRCRAALRPGGLMVMDIYGGPDAQRTSANRERKRGYTYVWDQARYNPITHDVVNHIHFRFPDGTRIMRAFSYDWRLWTLPELNDLLREAGFAEAAVYWEHRERDGSRTGVYHRREQAPAHDAWVAYVVGMK